jgi:hypothetical protein
MKITIVASVDFSYETKKVADELTASGHEVEIPYFTQKILRGEVDFEKYKKVKSERGDIEYRKNAEENLIKRYYNKIKNSDAILVLNLEKKGIPGYIGGNSFLEMGFAFVLGKTIFLYNSIPEMAYSDEIKEMDLVVINGDTSKISETG